MLYVDEEKRIISPRGESNPGLPRDRRGYSSVWDDDYNYHDSLQAHLIEGMTIVLLSHLCTCHESDI